MARSILPSTARRRVAVRLTGIRRAHRRSVNQRLRALARSTHGWDDLVGDGPAGRHGADPSAHPVLAAYPDRLIREVVVWERRSADKLAHFERWATAVTADLPIEDRLSTMRALLPGGLIGQHALSHLERLEAFDADEYGWRRRYRWREPAGPSRDELIDLARRVLATHGAHKVLNRSSDGRPLYGAHDVEAFVDHHVARLGASWLESRLKEALTARDRESSSGPGTRAAPGRV